jgi:hypothetical protein
MALTLCLAAVPALAPLTAPPQTHDVVFDHLGTTASVEKVFDATTKRMRLVSTTPGVSTGADLWALERANRSRYERLHGRLMEDLATKLEAAAPDDEFDVLVVVQHEELLPFDKTRFTFEEMEVLARDASIRPRLPRPYASVDDLRARYGLAPLPSARMPDDADDLTLRCRASEETLRAMAFDPDVASIEELFEPEPVTDISWDLLILSAFQGDYSMDSRGLGTHNATFESGLSDDFLVCEGIWPRPPELDAGGTPHSELTFHLMRETARRSAQFHRRSWNYSSISSQKWIIANRIEVLSQSTTSTTSPLSYLARVMDHFVFRVPRPLFCNPTANDGWAEVPDWGAYNGLSVGNVRHTSFLTYEMPTGPHGECTQARNPEPRYSTARDREMPYLVAPGYTPIAGALIGDCVEYAWCGTSFSAPIVNGICANVISANDQRLKFNPESVRAIVMLTAKNVHADGWNEQVDGLDGTGVISGTDAEFFARTCGDAVPDGPALVSGLDLRSLYWNEYQPIVYNVQVPEVRPEGQHLRVLLTWNSLASTASLQNDLSDLDLLSSSKRRSTSWESNVEVLDVPRDELAAGSIFRAIVDPLILRIPPGRFTYYSIAWTWVDDHAE